MIATEPYYTEEGNELVRTYSTRGFRIMRDDGTIFDDAVDPINSGRTYTEINEVAMEIKYSVRSIIRELKAINKFTAVRTLLETANYDWDFVGSNYLSSTDSDFQTMMAAIVSQGILTQAELDALLPKCIWEQTPMA